MKEHKPILTRSRLLSMLLLLLGVSLFGQNEAPVQEIGTSPYTVVYNHLFYLQKDSYNPLQAARSLSASDPASVKGASIKLKEILDGRGFFIDINRLPQDNNYYDSVRNEAIYVLNHNEPLIYVEKTNGKWSYSRTTLAEIDRLYDDLYPLNGAIRTYFEDSRWQVTFLGLAMWKWISLLVLLSLATVLFYLVYFILRRIGHAIAHIKRSQEDIVSKAISKLTRLLSLLVAVFGVSTYLPAIHLPPHVNSFAVKGLNILSIFFIIMVVIEIANLIFSYATKWSEKTESTMDDQLIPLLSKLVDILIWGLGLVFILDYLEVNVTALLAGISIGGLAIALAAQDTVKNVFGSVMIFLDRPFQIGDWISFDGVDGTVESVGIRSTRIRTFANSLTYVPNGIFAEKVIDNMGLRIYRRYKTEIGVTYDTPTYLIDLFVEGIRELITDHPFVRKDAIEVGLNSFGNSSINIIIYAFFTVDNWTDELRGKHDIMKGIINLAESIGVRFAFPSQTIFIEEMPGQIGLTPKKMDADAAKAARRAALDASKKEYVSPESEGEREKNVGGE